jgi:hypothetical protein
MRVYIQRYNTFFTSTATGPHGKSARRRFWSAPHSPSSKILKIILSIIIIIIIIQRISSRNLPACQRTCIQYIIENKQNELCKGKGKIASVISISTETKNF